MKGKILLVDDEINILNSYKRILRGHFDVDTAEHASIAIEMLKKNNYCVIVSDMSMPDINGIKLLNFSKKIKPNTVRIMLTGNADQKTATDAVNVGDVYRFINKPCSAQEFIDNINDAIKYHNLIIAEKLILSKTVKGIISVLNDVISLVCPQTSDRTIRLSHHMLLLADELEIKSTWSFEPMIQLSQLGYILFPDSEMSKTNNRNQQTEEELQLFNQHPCLAADLISKIPKMEGIANTILYQEKYYDGRGYPLDEVKEDDIPLGARMLKISLDYIYFEDEGLKEEYILDRMDKNVGHYDPHIFSAFKKTLSKESEHYQILLINISEGMVLAEDIKTYRDQLIARSGQCVTDSLIQIIRHCLQNKAVGGKVKIEKTNK